MKPPVTLLAILLLGGGPVTTFAADAAAATPAPSPSAYNPEFMKRAIAIAQTANITPDTDPFGAVIVQNGRIVGEGLSAMRKNGDVTAHGEVLAIREANKNLGKLDLSDCEIYTSCEPCPMCVAVIAIARIGKVYYAATLQESAVAFSVLPPNGRFGVNVPAIVAEEHATVDTRPNRPAEQQMNAESVEVMTEWAKKRAADLAKDPAAR